MYVAQRSWGSGEAPGFAACVGPGDSSLGWPGRVPSFSRRRALVVGSGARLGLSVDLPHS